MTRDMVASGLAAIVLTLNGCGSSSGFLEEYASEEDHERSLGMVDQLWDLVATGKRCVRDPAAFRRVASQEDCAAEASAAGHIYFQWRAQNNMCASFKQCNNEYVKDGWTIFRSKAIWQPKTGGWNEGCKQRSPKLTGVTQKTCQNTAVNYGHQHYQYNVRASACRTCASGDFLRNPQPGWQVFESPVPKHVDEVGCGEVIQNAWPISSAQYIWNKNCDDNPWLCSLEGRPWDPATGFIRKGNGDCISQCEIIDGCIAVMMDTSGATCYFMSDMSRWPLRNEWYTIPNPAQERFSVARVCRPTVPEFVTEVACGEVIENAWPLTSEQYIGNQDSTENPWLAAIHNLAWDAAMTGLIAKGNGNCISQCEATVGCTAVMMDRSGDTCFFMRDMSRWPLHYQLYLNDGPQWYERFSVARVCQEPLWKIGIAGESCSQTCMREAQTCSSDALQSLTGQSPQQSLGLVENKFQAAGFTCQMMKQDCVGGNGAGNRCIEWASPYIHQDRFAAGDCQSGFSGSGVAGCDAVPIDGNHQRLCPCLEPVWKIGLAGESCSDTCSSIGKSCMSSALQSLAGQPLDDFRSKFQDAGFTCQMMKDDCVNGNGAGNRCEAWASPYIHQDRYSAGDCQGGSSASPASLASCDATPIDGNHQRLCPCS